MRRVIRKFVLIGMALVLSAGVATAADPSGASLLNTDCIKCHVKPPTDMAIAGGKHAARLTCQACHGGHPPVAKAVKPQCGQCHNGKSHYDLKGCLGCHVNPHTPQLIRYGNDVTAPCLTCHLPQNEQLTGNKSKHSALSCSYCHDRHGRKPSCTDCHRSHSALISAADCAKCHRAHMPKVVRYRDDTPTAYCTACHSRTGRTLAATPYKHGRLACVTCHRASHGVLPECKSCHGAKHQGLMRLKPMACGECHGVAHDMYKWAAPAAAGNSASVQAPAGTAQPRAGSRIRAKR